MPVPVWVLDETGYIGFSNQRASLLAKQGLWAQARGGRLGPVGNLDSKALHAMLRLVGGSQETALTRVVSVAHGGQLLRGTLQLSPLAQTTLYAQAWPRCCVLLTLQLPMSLEHSNLWLDHVSERFMLTPAQSEVLEQLGRGRSVEEIALAMGIKEGTVRAHLHQLLSKTQLTKQADLVRLALGA